MAVRKIESIQVIDGDNGVEYEVGKNGIKEIVDNTVEFESSVYGQYSVKWENGNLVEVINCPVIVRYFPKEA